MQTARHTAFRITPTVRVEFEQIIDQRIKDVHVTKEDFSELKAIVKDIAAIQKRTETKLEELVDAQKRTEIALEKLSLGLDATRTELGGLSRSVSYSLENEAYRQLPRYLLETHGITITDRMVRFELEGEEINIFAKGSRNGKELFIVGESELKLSSVGKLGKLEKKVSLVKKRYEGECIPLMITHFVRPQVLEAANKKGIIIVQSFEW